MLVYVSAEFRPEDPKTARRADGLHSSPYT